MADFIFIDERGLKRRYKDMGDGTFAEVVSAAGAGGGGGGGAVTVADGADVTFGAQADAAAAADGSTASFMSLFRRLLGKFPISIGSKTSAGSLSVTLASDDAQVGTKVTAIAALAAGGVGIVGWLSQIWNELATRLPSAALPAGVDKSGSIATANTAVVLAAANAARKSLTGQNISTGDLWINEIGGTATANTAGSYKVGAGLAFSIATNRAISIVGATAAQAWTATET